MIKQRRFALISYIFVHICVCLSFCLLFYFGNAQAAPPEEKEQRQDKHVLFINSYGYDFETVPIIVNKVDWALKQTVSIQYLFMNEKYVDHAIAEKKLTEEIDLLTKGYKYDVVILGDDAAFDYAIVHRGKYFLGIPLIYENINSLEKAKKYQSDPLISGVVEGFPVKETIDVARNIQEKATKVVIITDNSPSGAGSVQQAMDHQKDFPDLTFEIFDCSKMTRSEIQRNIATYSDEAILLYTVFNVDGTGQRYSLAQGIKLITDAANVPVFKADEAGMGEGLLGGYQLSYASIGDETVKLVKLALDKKIPLPKYTSGKGVYQFDRKVMNKFNISKDSLPPDAVYINDEPTFYEQYYKAVWTIAVAFLIFIALIWERQRTYKRKIQENNIRLQSEKKANQAKTDFLSRMSHDIRTPLNGIIGMTYLAQQEQNPHPTQDALIKIDSSSKFLLALINDILDMTKVESNKVEIHPGPIAFADFKQSIESVIMPLCKEKNITYKTEFCPAGKYVPLFDNLRIKQVYFNLLSNAVKYNKPGGSIIFKMWDTLSADKKFITTTATVSDTGIGMSKEFLKVLFDPFTQENQKNDTQHNGTGLGLAIVKKMVELMDGTISVESKVGEGTTFRLQFVMPCIPAADFHQQTAIKAQEEKDLSVLQGKRVLLCDDQLLNQEIAGRVLEKAGMKVVVAENGQEALEAFCQSAEGFYQAVLMDIRMPIMDGLEATRAIRGLKREDAKTVPIIAMSANAFDEDVQTSLAAGMNAHLSKPINPKLVYQTLAQYM